MEIGGSNIGGWRRWDGGSVNMKFNSSNVLGYDDSSFNRIIRAIAFDMVIKAELEQRA